MIHAVAPGLSSRIFVPSTVMPEGRAACHTSSAEHQKDCPPGPALGRQEVTQTDSTTPSSEIPPLLLGWPEANFYSLFPTTSMKTPACIQAP